MSLIKVTSELVELVIIKITKSHIPVLLTIGIYVWILGIKKTFSCFHFVWTETDHTSSSAEFYFDRPTIPHPAVVQSNFANLRTSPPSTSSLWRYARTAVTASLEPEERQVRRSQLEFYPNS